jgi:thiamine biosynthesis lipoprotein
MSAEVATTFSCFGSTCSVLVIGDGPYGRAREAVERTERQLLAWHERFTRFEAGSELSLLNADPRATVPVSGVMARFGQAVAEAGCLSDGLVDATLVTQLEQAGYRTDLGPPVGLATALSLAPPRSPAAPSRAVQWADIAVDRVSRTITRPPGLKLDSGGLAKGLFADLLAARLESHDSFAVDCAGDLRVGGSARLDRPVQVASPFDGGIIHVFELADAGVATSGIGRRSWLDARGAPAHHLLDPATGRPAFTGVVQATALAPTGVEAEVRSKAAVLSGPDGAERWLPYGGVIVLEDGTYRVVASSPRGLQAATAR